MIERAKRVDSVSRDGFADMEVHASSLFMTIPLQTKANKSTQITFLCQFFILLEDINRKSHRSTRIPSLTVLTTFMEKVRTEATQLIGIEQNTERKGNF